MEVAEAARFMVSRNIKKLPITQGGRLLGILTLTDLCAAQPDLYQLIEKETKGKIPKRFMNIFRMEEASQTKKDIRFGVSM